MITPNDAVRTELRSALHDLADLLVEPGPHPYRVLNSIRHLWALSHLAVLEDHRKERVHELLHELGNAVVSREPIDRHAFANRLIVAADLI